MPLKDMSFDEVSSAMDERRDFRHRLLCIILRVWHELNDLDTDQHETIALAFRQMPRSNFERTVTAKKVGEEFKRLSTCSEADESCYEVYEWWTKGIRSCGDQEGIIDGHRRWFFGALGGKIEGGKQG
ncbi:MAG: hypothetical protein Q9176_005401 [Flavoplaca citrina]